MATTSPEHELPELHAAAEAPVAPASIFVIEHEGLISDPSREDIDAAVQWLDQTLPDGGMLGVEQTDEWVSHMLTAAVASGQATRHAIVEIVRHVQHKHPVIVGLDNPVLKQDAERVLQLLLAQGGNNKELTDLFHLVNRARTAALYQKMEDQHVSVAVLGSSHGQELAALLPQQTSLKGRGETMQAAREEYRDLPHTMEMDLLARCMKDPARREVFLANVLMAGTMLPSIDQSADVIADRYGDAIKAALGEGAERYN